MAVSQQINKPEQDFCTRGSLQQGWLPCIPQELPPACGSVGTGGEGGLDTGTWGSHSLWPLIEVITDLPADSNVSTECLFEARLR
jgi:hypothetical protein